MSSEPIPPSVVPPHAGPRAVRAGLVLAALGIVFGDIGTSPLYALRECFVGAHAMPLAEPNILGAVSLIFWFLVLIVCVKYVALMMQADNKGEGGVLALMALVERLRPRSKRMRRLVPLLGMVGAALLFGDGVVTPAVTVLGAIEGLNVATPAFAPWVVPLSLIVLTGLFALQSRGTASIGALFGPVLLVWFLTIGFVGATAVIKHPAILKAIYPWYAIDLLLHGGWRSMAIVSTVFLSVTGAEVLYADMGHFGRSPIRRAWFMVVFPALLLSYMGQGAYLLGSSGVPENLFYLLSPRWFLYPLVVIATLAAIIASQAVISGTFSLARQAVQLGLWPRIRVVHTSRHTIGQVYVPLINLALFAATVALILTFRHSGRLVGAYGIAVSATMFITTLLALLVARKLWHVPRWVVIVVGGFFFALHLSLLAVNLAKLFSGGWVVVVLAALVCLLMTTWVAGRAFLRGRSESEAVPQDLFVKDIVTLKPARVSGTAAFFSANTVSVPRAMLHNYKHNKVIHEHTLMVTVLVEDSPTVESALRSKVTPLGQGLYDVELHYGFMDNPRVADDLAAMSIPGVLLGQQQVTYFLGKELLALTQRGRSAMPLWRRRLFAAMANNSQSAAAFFSLPPGRVVELGLQVEL
jgi:KUP system potassium uptake protein